MPERDIHGGPHNGGWATPKAERASHDSVPTIHGATRSTKVATGNDPRRAFTARAVHSPMSTTLIPVDLMQGARTQ